MSTVAELENAIPKLSRGDLEAFRRWFEEYLEDQLELRDEVVAALDQSKVEIAAGHYRTRQPSSAKPKSKFLPVSSPVVPGSFARSANATGQ